MEAKPKRINWHNVVFWSSLIIAIELMWLSSVRSDHRVLTIFDRDGRDQLRRDLHVYFPDLAAKLGVSR